jgi:hypothetical protein
VVLLAKRGNHSMVQSLTAPFCLLNALAIGVATAKKSKSLQALSQLDQMAAVYWAQPNGKSQKRAGRKDGQKRSKNNSMIDERSGRRDGSDS